MCSNFNSETTRSNKCNIKELIFSTIWFNCALQDFVMRRYYDLTLSSCNSFRGGKIKKDKNKNS